MNFIHFLNSFINNEKLIIYYVDLKHTVKGYHEPNDSYSYSTKEALYKTFKRYIEKIEKEYELKSEKVFISSDDYEINKDKYDGFAQRRKKDILIEEDKGYYVGYRLLIDEEKLSVIAELFRLKNLRLNIDERSRLTSNPSFYFDNQ
ncbi:hypothetical protein [Flammeovirga pacifica]|uniref:Uncharacterized protein n=1 Tax=Flammeovirga pacifica TaxID=915059 RepID=A0A1S1YT92_FLAPC|nr:hypothetical protein [Flammeovirga pacifica]OHX64025.1 hypothetical protein NH26_20670 [Flammeovirga pacifica]